MDPAPAYDQSPAPPSTPGRGSSPWRSPPHATLSPVSSSSLGGDSPERTPGPGEQSPDAREARSGSAELSSLLQEAEERSSRRVQAIQGVLSGLRDATQQRCSKSNDLQDTPPRRVLTWARTPPLPFTRGVPTTSGSSDVGVSEPNARIDQEEEHTEPRAPPPQATPPLPLPLSSGQAASHFLNAVSARVALDHGNEVVPAHTPAEDEGSFSTKSVGVPGSPPASKVHAQPSRRERTDAWSQGLQERLEARVEEQQQALERAFVTCKAEEEAAQEARVVLIKAETNAAFMEGTATRREAQLQSELVEMRSAHQKERERLRTEARRLQSSVRDMQARVKTEQDGRTKTAAELEAVRQQVASAKTEMQRRGKDGQEVRAALSTLEKRSERHVESFRWIIKSCAEALGEDSANVLQSVENGNDRAASVGPDELEDGMRRVVSRTLMVLQRRIRTSREEDKENQGERSNAKGGPGMAVPTTSLEASAQRLASAQSELLHARAEAKELDSARRCLQERLTESELELEAMGHGLRKGPIVGLRTEGRSRIRALMDEQRCLQIELAELEHQANTERDAHEEECERLRSKLSTLQRAKESGERYIETEEDAWTESKCVVKRTHEEMASLRSEMQRAEDHSESARADAVEARVAALSAEATKRRVEAELEALRAISATPSMHSASPVSADVNLEKLRFRAELARRDEACVQEVSLAQRDVEEWRVACLRVEGEASALTAKLAEEQASCRRLQLHFETSAEEQERQRFKIDEAKRSMVQKAMEEQAVKMKRDFEAMLSASQSRCEDEAAALQHCKQELTEQHESLDNARNSVNHLKQQTSAFEDELRQQVQALAREEEALCVRNREELHAANAKESAAIRESEARALRSFQASEELYAAEEVASALESARTAHEAAAARVRSAHVARLAAIREEHFGELASMRRLEEDTTRHFEAELVDAFRDHESLAEIARDAKTRESEGAVCARQAIQAAELAARSSIVATVEQERRAFEVSWRNEHFEMAHAVAVEKVKKDVLENPCSELRKALCRDIRQELRDQMRSEQRSSELSPSPFSSSASYLSPDVAVQCAAKPFTAAASSTKAIARAGASIPMSPWSSQTPSMNAASPLSSITASASSAIGDSSPLCSARGITSIHSARSSSSAARRELRGAFAEAAERLVSRNEVMAAAADAVEATDAAPPPAAGLRSSPAFGLSESMPAATASAFPVEPSDTVGELTPRKCTSLAPPSTLAATMSLENDAAAVLTRVSRASAAVRSRLEAEQMKTSSS